MVPNAAFREKKWREHCPGSTIVKYIHPSGRTTYTYISASEFILLSWKLLRAVISQRRGNIDQNGGNRKGAKLSAGANIPDGHYLFISVVCVSEVKTHISLIASKQGLTPLPVLLSGQKFRSWKQCVKFMGQDPLASMVSNGEETHPSSSPPAGEDYNLELEKVEALPWRLVGIGSSDPSAQEEKGSLLNGDRSLARKDQSLNVISSSSEESLGSKSPPIPPSSRQAIISISSSQELDNEKDGSDSSSSSSSSSEKSISPPSSYGNSPFSSPSSEELDDRQHAPLHMANEFFTHSHNSRPSLNNVEKPQVQLVTAEDDHRFGYRAAIAQNRLRTLRLLTNGVINEPEQDAANSIPSPKLLHPDSPARARVIPSAHSGAAEAAVLSLAREGNINEQEARGSEEAGYVSDDAVDRSPSRARRSPDSKAEDSKKRKACGREEETEESESLKSKITVNRASVAEEPVTTNETKGSKPLQNKTLAEDDDDKSDSREEDESSDESLTSLKELMWKMFEEAMKRRGCQLVFSSRRKTPKAIVEQKKQKER